jgi:hypothetical protein
MASMMHVLAAEHVKAFNGPCLRSTDNRGRHAICMLTIRKQQRTIIPLIAQHALSLVAQFPYNWKEKGLR